MRTWIALIALAACSSKSAPPPDKGSAVAPKPAVAPDAGSAADKSPPVAKPKRPPPTKEQSADLKKHMKAGWAKQKAKQWAEAVVEFEAALGAVPADPRGLAELGWSAMNAGDFPKARKADEQAIRVAVDKKVKAAALYNLGQVQEKSGDNPGALKSYIASFALRPNKTVEQAVTKLGATPQAEQPFCAKGQKLCDCLIADAVGEVEPEDPVKCEVSGKPPVASFKIYHVENPTPYGWSYDYLIDEHDQRVAVIGGVAEHGRHTEETALDKAEVKTIAGHQVLWVETTQTDNATWYGKHDGEGMDIEELSTTSVTICVVGDDKTPTRCPLRAIPKHTLHNFEENVGHPDKKVDRTESTLDIALGNDGTVTIKLVKGASDEQIDALVGPHKLW